MRGRVAAVLLACMAVLVLAGPASAAGGQAGDCRDEPIPEAPGRGVTGWVSTAPTPIPAGAKFTPDGVPRFEQYGFAGMRWNAYDLGCGGDWVRAPDAMLGTLLGNWTLEGSKFGVGLTGAVTDAAYHPSFLSVFDPLLRNSVDTLRTTLFNRWVAVFVALAGVILLWKATRLRFASAAGVAVWALVVMIAASVIFSWPVAAGSFVDRGVGATVGAVHRGINRDAGTTDPATAATQSTYYAVLWNQWKAGEFGSASSPVAHKYAADLFDAQSLTWREARIVAADPDGRGQELLDAKQDKFYDTANKIKDEDPDAYLYVTGKKSETRVAMALFALVAALCVLPLLLMSAVLIIASYLIVRLAVMLFPAIATIGVAHTFRGLVKGLAAVVGAAVINCVVFAIGAAVNLLFIRILLSPSSHLPTWLGLLLSALVAVVMWFALKPFRRLTQMASPSHNVIGETTGTMRRAGHTATRLAGSAVGAVATGGVAGAAAGAVVTDDDEDEKPAQRAARPESYSAPDPSTPEAPRGVGGVAPAAALPPGPVAASPTPPTPAAPMAPLPPPVGLPQAPHVHGPPPAIAAAPPDSGAAAQMGEIPAPPAEHQSEVWPGVPSSTPPADAADRSPAGSASGPAADTTVDDGGGIYYTPEGQPAPGPESEPDMVEPELDDTGAEVHPFYHPDPDREDASR